MLRIATLRIIERHILWVVSSGIMFLRLLVLDTVPFSHHSHVQHGKPREELRELGPLTVTLPWEGHGKTFTWRSGEIRNILLGCLKQITPAQGFSQTASVREGNNETVHQSENWPTWPLQPILRSQGLSVTFTPLESQPSFQILIWP